MSNYNNDEFDTFDEGEAAPEEANNNRTFLLAAGGLGLVFLLGLLCLGGYLFFTNRNNQAAQTTVQAQNLLQETLIAQGLTQTAQAVNLTQTAAITPTVPPTNTPVIAQATVTPSPTQNPATATVGAAFTQIAVSTQTIIPTSTALPQTGFMDEAGLPGMFALAFALIIVIFLVRRLRAAPVR